MRFSTPLVLISASIGSVRAYPASYGSGIADFNLYSRGEDSIDVFFQRRWELANEIYERSAKGGGGEAGEVVAAFRDLALVNQGGCLRVSQVSIARQ